MNGVPILFVNNLQTNNTRVRGAECDDIKVVQVCENVEHAVLTEASAPLCRSTVATSMCPC